MGKKFWSSVTTFVFVITLLSLVTVACAQPAPAPAPAPSPAPAPAPSPAPSPSPAPAPAPSPAPSPSPAPAPAPAPANVELVFGMHSPPLSGHGIVAEAWYKELEKRSGGRIKIKYFPAGALVANKDQYDFLVAGNADIIQTNPGYTPGRFPSINVAIMPFTVPDCIVAAQALQATFESTPTIQQEFSAVRSLFYATTQVRQLFTARKAVRGLADMKGLKIRATDDTAAVTLTYLGAVPVIMPPTEVYTGMERGIIDGVLFEWDAATAFKAAEVSRYVTLLDINLSLFGTWMNKDSYNKLPSDLQRVIDSVSGIDGSLWFGTGMSDKNAKDYVTISGSGNIEFITLSSEERQNFVKAVTPQYNAWVKSEEDMGKPGADILNTWRKEVARFSK
ncbi:MAG: TRAP transporter substrate-binding protein [Chloroflexota bacterium]